MAAFVPNGVSPSLSRPASGLTSGLRSICGHRSASTARDNSAHGSAAGIKMSGTYGITLQTLLYEPNPVFSSVSDKDMLCNLVWRQVFGNAYVMESERAEAYKAESMYRAGEITVREFVRAVAQTSTYRRRFFECCGPYRAVELNFKHLLGRGPTTQEEASEHIRRIANEGYAADIDSYIDSEEYDLRFGDDYVPGLIFKGTYPTIEEFNSMCAMYSAPGTTDKSLTARARALGIDNPNRVLSLDGAGIPSKTASRLATRSSTSFVSVVKGIPKRPDLDFGVYFGPGFEPKAVNERAKPKKRIEITPGSYMYLTEEEAKEYAEDAAKKARVKIMAERELKDAETQLAALEMRISELRAVV